MSQSVTHPSIPSTATSSPEVNIPLATSLKEQGNSFATKQKHMKAIELYTESLKHNPFDHIVYSNRSGMYLSFPMGGKYFIENAENDAKEVIRLKPDWPKGYLRLGAALEAQNNLEAALQQYEQGIQYDPTNTTDLSKCITKVKERIAFEEANRPLPTLAQCLVIAKETVPVLTIQSRLYEQQQEQQASSVVPMIPSISTASSRTAATVLPLLSALAQPYQDTLRIEYRPGKGRCLIAQRCIPAYSTVLHEPAIGWYPSYSDRIGGTLPALLHRSSVYKQNDQFQFESLLLQLAPFGIDTVNKHSQYANNNTSGGTTLLPESLTKTEIYVPVAMQNALGVVFDEDASMEEKRIMLLCPVADMANSDCLPTCSYTGVWDHEAKAPAIRFFAERDIKEGEEITIAYANRSDNKHDRIQKLRRYGFVCTCNRCSPDYNDSVVYKCPYCRTGRVYENSVQCMDCSKELSIDQTKENGELYRKAMEFFNQNEKNAPVLAGTDETIEASCPVHPLDQQRGTLLYTSLALAWNLPPKERAQVFARAAEFPALKLRGHVFLWDILFLSGHMSALAGKTDDALLRYQTVEKITDSLFGSNSSQSILVRKCIQELPRTMTDLARLEHKRQENGNWLYCHYGGKSTYTKKIYETWRKPIDASNPQESSHNIMVELSNIGIQAMKSYVK